MILIRKCITAYICLMIVHSMNCQSTSDSRCTYIFHVPLNDQGTCPGNSALDSNINNSSSYDDGGLTKAQMTALISNQQEQLAMLTKSWNEVTGRLEALESERDESQSSSSFEIGVNYIRWGRTVCPDTSTKLYEGYAAKSLFNHAGGGANFICLHNNPQAPENAQSGFQFGGHIYGVEYESMPDTSLNQDDVPCTACIVSGRSQKIMVPGRLECDEGWTLEYNGLLVAAHISHTKSTYMCLDNDPETREGGAGNVNGGLIYPVEAACNPLPCPPYEHGSEISCVVCTK